MKHGMSVDAVKGCLNGLEVGPSKNGTPAKVKYEKVGGGRGKSGGKKGGFRRS